MTLVGILNGYFLEVRGNALWDITKSIWSEVTKRDWEELYLDAFEAALAADRERLAKYGDGLISLPRKELRRILHQELAVPVSTLSMSQLTSDQFASELAEALGDSESLIIGGHTLSPDDYASLLRGIVRRAMAIFKGEVQQKPETVVRVLVREMERLQLSVGEVRAYLEDVVGVDLDEIREIARELQTVSKETHQEVMGLRNDFARFEQRFLSTDADENVETGFRLHNILYLPRHFLPRPKELTVLKEKVLGKQQGPVAVSGKSQAIAVQGMGGVGKSVLAAALAYEDDVQAAFPDGIYWITLGQDLTEAELIGRQAQLARALGKENVAFQSWREGKAYLRDLLDGRACLLILDDVWNGVDAAKFDFVSEPGRLLITTRDSTVVQAMGAQEYRLDVLNVQQALRLLAKAVISEEGEGVKVEELPNQANGIVKECGNLPLAIAMIGGMIAGMEGQGRDGWGYALHRLKTADLRRIRREFPNYPYSDMLKAMHVSVAALHQDEALQSLNSIERYLDLAVFPGDGSIPESVLAMLWQRAGLDQWDTQELIATFVNRSLVQPVGKGMVRLHDLQGDYVRQEARDVKARHERLLEAYAEICENGWASGPDDGYFFEQLSVHLPAAGREQELKELLLNFEWLQAKLQFTDVSSLIADYDLQEPLSSHNLIQSAIRLSAPAISKDASQLAGQLIGRLLALPGLDAKLERFVEQIDASKQGIWLRPLRGTLTPPNSPLHLTFTEHQKPVETVVVSPDHDMALSVSWDTVVMWNIGTGESTEKLSLPIEQEAHVRAVEVTPDWKHVVYALAEQVFVWDLKNAQTIATFQKHDDSITALALTPDGKLALSSSYDNTVRVWETRSGEEKLVFSGHKFGVTAIALTTDGQLAITASTDGQVKIWKIADGQEVRTFSIHEEMVNAIATTPDNKLILVATNKGTIWIWDVKGEQEERAFTVHTESIDSLTIIRDGKMCLSASSKQVLGWMIGDGQETLSFSGHSLPISKMVVTDDGRRMLSASWDSTIKVWNLEEPHHISTVDKHEGMIFAVEVSPNGKHALSASEDATVKVWSVEQRQEVLSFTEHNDWVTALYITKDSRLAISASGDRTIRVWDIISGRKIALFTEHNDDVNAVTLTPNGRIALSASSDGTLLIWKFPKGRVIRTCHDHGNNISALAMMPDGHQVLTGSKDGEIKLWDYRSCVEVKTFTGHTSTVNSLAVTPDGRLLLSGSSDWTMRLWDVESGLEVASIKDYEGPVYDVASTHDGRFAISASGSKRLDIIEIDKRRTIAAFDVDEHATSCASTPDGRIFIVGDVLGQVHFLRLEGLD